MKYLFNCNVYGYELANIGDFNEELKDEDSVIVVVDNTATTDTGKYYQLVEKAINTGCKVYLIGVDDENNVFSGIASNMLAHRSYNIYNVADKDVINADYLAKILGREADITEAEAFLPKDVVAYNDMCSIIYGIESLVNEGDINGLKTHIERHIATIDGMIPALNKMKMTCEQFNSDELVDKIKQLKTKYEELNSEMETKNGLIDDIKHSKEELEVEVRKLKRELNELKENGSGSDGSGATTIKSYSAYNISLHTPKTKHFMYFKEISYVRYTNTLVTCVTNYIENLHKSWKLLIYDNNVNALGAYGIDVVTGENYIQNRSSIIKSKKMIVVAEPIAAIIPDIINSPDAPDVLIVYDKLRMTEDIISGNLINKIFVANSKRDVAYIKNTKSFKIGDGSNILTYAYNNYKDNDNIQNNFMDIPSIEQFAGGSDSSKMNKYMRLATARTKKKLIAEVLRVSNIELR